jgi:transcriptional regulator with XRE-family HTH domain
MPEINEKIKEMRQRRGLTLLEVADFLGVKEATVQRYESGNIKNIKHETICKLAELFQCDPCYLMGWDGSVNASFNNNAFANGTNATAIVTNNGEFRKELSDQAAELLRVFENLDVRGQTELLTCAFEIEKKYRK